MLSSIVLIDTNSFILQIKIQDFHEDIKYSVEKRFDKFDFETEKFFTLEENAKFIGMMKDEFDGQIMTEFVELRPKMYTYAKRQ